ncbi:MAG: class I SAM-dependent methyltransferase [Thermoanaerobaculales bacterium]|jgi:SAM-dependent methyltransferase|nr:class I SAM-dependent methyltransferase [Thermoanaerobaculales bacterium]
MTIAARDRLLGLPPSAFSRDDESDDRLFYGTDRMVPHLDAEALGVVASIIGGLITEERPVILDLMASWDSHLGPSTAPARVVGLGLNRRELEANPALDEVVVHDLNAEPALPFADQTFDVVLNTVSIDYLTRPAEVVAEAARVLRPGGLLLVLFSNRFFPEKVVRIWREATTDQRLALVEGYFGSCPILGPTASCEVHGRPRPVDDRYAALGLPSDPVVAVWAERTGGPPGRPVRRPPELEPWFVCDPDELARRKAAVGDTLACPFCGDRLRKWAVPQTPFTEWDEEYLRVCFNDRCPYLLRGWRAMERQGNRGFSYRLMFNPGNRCCLSLPVPSLSALRESIVDE